MNNGVAEISSCGAAENSAELRQSPRFTSLIRTAKLVGESGEYLCVLRDVSATGLKLRLFHDGPSESRLTLELANGDHYAVERVWAEAGTAGFRFVEPIAVDAVIREDSPFRKRPVRVRLNQSARISIDDFSDDVMVRDLSQQGMRIEYGERLAMDQRVGLELAGLPSIAAKVRWRKNGQYGLVLEQTFRLEELAKLAARLQH